MSAITSAIEGSNSLADLAARIRKQAAALAGAVLPAELGRALSIYVANPVYRARLVVGASRIDLDGSIAGVVTPEEIPSPAPPPSSPPPTPPSSPPPAPSPSPPRRLSFADLRAAAAMRRELEGSRA
jgi:ProQ/FINO family